MISFLAKLKSWARRRKHEELRGEIRFHLEEDAGERRAEGLPDEEAQSAALRDFGNVLSVQEEDRALWTWTFWEQAIQDLRYAVRTLRRNPLFTAVAAGTFALGNRREYRDLFRGQRSLPAASSLPRRKQAGLSLAR